MQTGAEAVVTRSFAPRTPPDNALMEEIRGGNVAALGELFERHHETLYGFLVRLVRDRTTADDLVQEVFVRILKYGHTFRLDSQFVPWMLTLARHAAVDFHRARPRELPEDPEAPEPVATGPQPIEALERADRMKDLNRALGRLPMETRETLLLARFSGLKYVDIAAILGISEGAVKARVHRAVGDLKKTYRAETGRSRRSGLR